MIKVGSIVKFTGPFVASPTYEGLVINIFENGSIRFFDPEYGTVTVTVEDMTDRDCSFRVVSL